MGGSPATARSARNRLLRPVRDITSAARNASADSLLDQRIALDGPHDELREMADTFDDMLRRLHQSFDAQRRIGANAAHELRTPLAVIRAEVDAARTNPAAEPRELALADRIETAATRSERIVDALLTLAQADAGIQDLTDVDLGTLVGDIVLEHARRFTEAHLEVNLELIDHGDPTALHIKGDAILLDRLVTNLVDNAIRHATPHTTVDVEIAATETPQSAVNLRVTNDASPLDLDVTRDLSEPFRRGSGRIGDKGHGLGLAIVHAAATSHHATLDISHPTPGSFEVNLTFPTVGRQQLPEPV